MNISDQTAGIANSFTGEVRTAFSRWRLLLSAAGVTLLLATPVVAEDIEIYEGLTGAASSDTPTEAKPNILFVLDTSGSMGEPEVVLNARPPYDATFDYGDPGSNDNVYIYDSDKVYTGMFTPSSNNLCKASDDFASDNPEFPEYRDKVLVWQYKPPVTENVTTCGNAVTVSETDFSTDRRSWDRIADFDANPGDAYEVRFSVQSYGYIYARFADDNNNFVGSYICYRQVSNNSTTLCDTGTVPSGATKLRTYFYRQGRSRGNNATASYTKPGECTTTPVTTPAQADWVTSVDDPSEIRGVECEADEGVHGSGAAGASPSTDAYPQYQESGNTNLTSPNYVGVSTNTYAVDWDSSAIPEAYIFTGNYHDYLQTEVADLLEVSAVAISGTDLDDVRDFCKQTGGITTFGANSPFEGVRTQTYPNGGIYVEHNDAIYQCQTRIGALKEATRNLFGSMSGANVGMMRFNFETGGSLLSAVRDIDGDTTLNPGDPVNEETVSNRDVLIDKLLALPGVGATPLQETLYEAYLYMAGKTPLSATEEKQIAPTDSTVDYPTNITSTTADLTDLDAISDSGNYISPIKNQCQDNNIILFSDGEATRDVGRVSEISSFSGRSCSNTNDGDCLDELAWGMANKDVNRSVDKVNNVYLYTIGFGDDVAGSTQLLNASNEGLRPGALPGSQHYEATNSQDLTTAFQSILLSLGSVTADSFVAPAVAVNAFNRLQFREELYFAVFEPSNTPRWYGNIKKYKVNSDGEILDANLTDAVDQTGFFREGSKSFWSDTTDGFEVRKGGAARELDLDPVRKLFGSLKSDTTTVTALTASNFLEKVYDEDNSSVMSIGEVSSPDFDTNRSNIVKWTFGQDVEQDLQGAATDPNYFLAESLHSTPFVVDYGTADESDDVLFVTTNQGTLHAINGENGQERWSYVPDPSLFQNLGSYFNQIVNADHQYGLDGEMTFDVVRKADRSIDYAHIFVGQRRGGEKYFAIDVSNADGADTAAKPVSKMWTLDSLPRMAQSWAKPVLATINWCPGDDASCAPRDVVVLSGGYDPKYDDYEASDGTAITLASLKDTVQGNAIYIVDRATGTLLWMAGKDTDQVNTSTGVGYYTNAEMGHSFPSEPTVVDANFDGVADLMFAIDIAGRVWRFDFRGDFSVDSITGDVSIDANDIRAGDNNSSSEVAAGIIADLSESGVDRRFYNKLDVSLTPRTATDLARYNLVTGSGYRAHPLLDEGDTNRIYFVFDRNLQFPKLTADADGTPTAVSYNYVSDTDRIESSTLAKKTNATALNTLTTHKHGFYIELQNGTEEKMLNPTLTNDGLVIAVSYNPSEVVSTDSGLICEKNLGGSFLYQIDLFTGQGAFTELDKAGIGTNPVVIEVDDESNPGDTVKVLIIGSESFSGRNPPVTVDDGGDIDRLEDPGLNDGNVGDIEKINWWERRKD